MEFTDALDPLRKLARRLSSDCRKLPSHPLLARLALRLDQMQESTRPPERPIVVALLGGTGVGKSELFNALTGIPEASPTSATIRPKTSAPVISRRPADHPHLANLPMGIQYVDSTIPWLALVDTPDVDGLKLEHWEITRQVIEQSDIILYVTSPQKYANEAVSQFLRPWVTSKRWFFALNQIDRVEANESTLKELKSHFDQHLRKLGFEPNHESRFLVSAKDPSLADFPVLKGTLMRERSRETAAAHAVDALLGKALHASNSDTIQTLNDIRTSLSKKQRELESTLLEQLQQAIQLRNLTEKLRPLLRQMTWASLPSRVRGPLSIPVSLHARFAALASAFQLWKLTTAGFSLWRIGLLFGSIFQAMKGGVELQNIIATLEKDIHPELDRIRRDVLYFLEDQHLMFSDALEDLSLSPPSSPASSDSPSSKSSPSHAHGETPSTLVTWVSNLEKALKTGGVPSEHDSHQRSITHELTPIIQEALNFKADEYADKSSPLWLNALFNLPPVYLILHAFYELCRHWFTGQWLSGTFYLHGFALFFLTLLPGYILIHFLVDRQMRRADFSDTIFKATGKMPPVGPVSTLDEVSVLIERIEKSLSSLKSQALVIRDAINQDYSISTIGSSGRDV